MIAAPAFVKEVRALLPAFAATLATIGLATAASYHLRLPLVVLLACLGPLVLGSLSIGHEYSHRTLTLLLAQPRGRGSLFFTKAAVLVPMLAAIVVAAAFALPPPARDVFTNTRREIRALLVLAPLCGLCLAPLLSMLCRSTLAAIVFTVAIPGVFITLGELIGLYLYGFNSPGEVETFRLAFVWRSIPVLCVAAAGAAWPLFNRLQAIDGQGELQMAAWLGRESAAQPIRRVHSAWTSLLWKELRLQQISFVVVALYLAGCAAVWVLQASVPGVPGSSIEVVSVLYSGLLAILIGSVASAEERQLGMLPSQLLQPMAAGTQWIVKTGTVIVLSLVLSVVLPLLINRLIGGPESDVWIGSRFVKQILVPWGILTALSLHVSSWSSSGVRAMIVSLPVIAGTGLFGMIASSFVTRVAHAAYPFDWTGVPSAEQIDARVRAFKVMSSVTDASVLIGLLIISTAAVWLAFRNHRHIDRSGRELARHAAILGSAVLVMASIPALIWLALRPGG